MTRSERFKGCILGGAIGDALGSGYENLIFDKDDVFYPLGKPKPKTPKWQITDDTQLTLATIEAIIEDGKANPESVANKMLKYYKQRKLKGIGASTLKALEELSYGIHWSQTGRKGEYAAGNGAAMRIAPIAFIKNISNARIRDICLITHNNDEAYIGCRCVIISIKEILKNNWDGTGDLIQIIIDKIPDTRVRDRLLEIKDVKSIKHAGGFGSSGYVVDSVPLAIFAASKVIEIGINSMYDELIKIGGDTDTNCSIAGQIAGTLLGEQAIPKDLLLQLQCLKEYGWIDSTINKYLMKNEC